MEILMKCSDAFDMSAVVMVGNKLGLMQEDQVAYKTGIGVETPLLMWTLLGEEAYLHKLEHAEGEGDAKRAFDAPHRYTTEMCMRRMGIPEWYVEAQSKRQAEAETAVITPFGLTDWFGRAQGLTQGGTSSPQKWIWIMDVLAVFMKRVAGGAAAPMPDEYGRALCPKAGRLSARLGSLS